MTTPTPMHPKQVNEITRLMRACHRRSFGALFRRVHKRPQPNGITAPEAAALIRFLRAEEARA